MVRKTEGIDRRVVDDQRELAGPDPGRTRSIVDNAAMTCVYTHVGRLSAVDAVMALLCGHAEPRRPAGGLRHCLRYP